MSETLRSGSAKYPIRSVRFKYLRNFYPSRPYLQPNRYKDDKAVVQAMRRLLAEQELTPEQARIMAETRPREELYDLQSDPHELHTGSGAALPGLTHEAAEHSRPGCAGLPSSRRQRIAAVRMTANPAQAGRLSSVFP